MISRVHEFVNNSIDFTGVIYGKFYGGNINIQTDSEDIKSYLFAGYSQKNDRAYTITSGTSTATDSFYVDIKKYYADNLYLELSGTTEDITRVYVAMSIELERLSNSENTANTGSFENRYQVSQGGATLTTEQITFRVSNEDINLVKSILQNKVYLDGKEFLLNGNIQDRWFDNNQRAITASFVEVLNE